MDQLVYKEMVQPLLNDDPLPVINFMKEKGLLAKEMKCSDCQTFMNWGKYSALKDKNAWKCQQKKCLNYSSRVTIRRGSFFAHSQLSLQTWIYAIYLWSEERISTKIAMQLLNVSNKTIIDIYYCFREVCIEYFENNPVQLGGPEIVIEESCFSLSHSQKASQKPLWVFGLVDTSTKPTIGYMEIVESQSAETLLPIIMRVVTPGSIIHTKQWKEYIAIQQELGLTDKTNHSIQFLEKVADVHTKTIESYWNEHKNFFKKMHGCRHEHLNSYLREYMWHERHTQNKFISFCNNISMQYNPKFTLL